MSGRETEQKKEREKHLLFTPLHIGILMLKAIGRLFIKLTGDAEKRGWRGQLGGGGRRHMLLKGPKISGAKMNPLRLPFSALFPIPSLSLCTPHTLPLKTAALAAHAHLKLFFHVYPEICISVLSPKVPAQNLNMHWVTHTSVGSTVSLFLNLLFLYISQHFL